MLITFSFSYLESFFVVLHLSFYFYLALCGEVLKYQHAHPDSSLAPPTPQRAWLKDITPAYLHKRALQMWMDKNPEQNIAGEMAWPWTTRCLSETNWYLWKVLCIGKKGEMGAMKLKEEGCYALCKFRKQLNLGVAEEQTWTLGSTSGRSGGHVSGTGYKPLDEIPLNCWDERRFAEYRLTQPLLLTYGGTISGGRKPPSTQGKVKDVGAAQVFSAGYTSVGYTMAQIVPKEVLQICVAPLVCFVCFNRQL